MALATVKYQVATYSGEIVVACDIDADNDTIIARAKSILRRNTGGSLPFGYESFKVISIDD